MRNWRVWVCAAAVVLVVAASGLGSTRPSLGQVADPSLSPHLGYGINVRFQQHVESLFAPLGFEWLKLWEEYDSLPTTRYPYQVLFLIDCYGRSGDLHAWRNDVRAIATAGKGLVEAYEICNEPNFAQWVNKDVDPHVPPDPALYVQMLQVAYETIKEVDPAAIVASAGLAPVGRIQGTCNGWSGNNCSAMDEREYARQMLLLGAGDYLDAFGYHPYGFAYSPETDPYSVSNGFAFRGAEVMYGILEDHGLGDTQIWATEFSWLRDPSYDPDPAGWCHLVAEYENNFGWMDMSEANQADFFTRAFQYADEHWPWMGALIVWNLDWYNYNWLCEPSRYFSVRKNNGTDLGAPAPAYDSLAVMEKRPGHFGPRLVVTPTLLSFQAEEAEPQVFEGVVTPLNAARHYRCPGIAADDHGGQCGVRRRRVHGDRYGDQRDDRRVGRSTGGDGDVDSRAITAAPGRQTQQSRLPCRRGRTRCEDGHALAAECRGRGADVDGRSGAGNAGGAYAGGHHRLPRDTAGGDGR